MLNQVSLEEENEETFVTVRNACREYLWKHNLCVPAAWLLQGESEPEADDLNYGKENLEKIICSADFFLADDKKTFLKICRVSAEEISHIAAATVGQRANQLYLGYKKYRITASNFGYVIGAIGRNSYPESLFGRLLNTANLEKVN